MSLPQETFYSSGASVKASLLFLQKFTVDEQNRFNEVKAQAEAECRGAHQAELDELENDIKQPQYNPMISTLRTASRPTQNAPRPMMQPRGQRQTHRPPRCAVKRLKELTETIRQERGRC